MFKSRSSLNALERTLTAKISDYAMTVSDFTVFVDSTRGPVSITLPEASNEGKMVFVQKIDDSANDVLVRCVEGDTINRINSLSATKRWEGWMLIADGIRTWFIVSRSMQPFVYV